MLLCWFIHLFSLDNVQNTPPLCNIGWKLLRSWDEGAELEVTEEDLIWKEAQPMYKRALGCQEVAWVQRSLLRLKPDRSLSCVSPASPGKWHNWLSRVDPSSAWQRGTKRKVQHKVQREKWDSRIRDGLCYSIKGFTIELDRLSLTTHVNWVSVSFSVHYPLYNKHWWSSCLVHSYRAMLPPSDIYFTSF